jgi:hypothetical protein
MEIIDTLMGAQTPNSFGQGMMNDPKLAEYQNNEKKYYPDDRPRWVGDILLKLDRIEEMLNKPKGINPGKQV